MLGSEKKKKSSRNSSSKKSSTFKFTDNPFAVVAEKKEKAPATTTSEVEKERRNWEKVGWIRTSDAEAICLADVSECFSLDGKSSIGLCRVCSSTLPLSSVDLPQDKTPTVKQRSRQEFQKLFRKCPTGQTHNGIESINSSMMVFRRSDCVSCKGTEPKETDGGELLPVFVRRDPFSLAIQELKISFRGEHEQEES